MTDNQENKRKMYLAVQEVCTTNETIWNSLPAFVNAFQEFQTHITNINTQSQIQESATTGITQDKEQEKKEMIQATINMASRVYAYAAATNNNQLQEQVNYTPSKLKTMRNTVLIDACQNIHNRANEVIAVLADYGITPEDLVQLQQEIDDFSGLVTAPRTAINTRTTATAALVDLFAAADNILKEQLDKLMVTYQNTEPTFYNTYQNARIIVDLGKGGSTTSEDTEQEPPIL